MLAAGSPVDFMWVEQPILYSALARRERIPKPLSGYFRRSRGVSPLKITTKSIKIVKKQFRGEKHIKNTVHLGRIRDGRVYSQKSHPSCDKLRASSRTPEKKLQKQLISN